MRPRTPSQAVLVALNHPQGKGAKKAILMASRGVPPSDA
jgi:hypothetical protein